MQVTLVFEDRESLTAKEITQNLKHLYGSNADVSVTPSGNSPESHIYFGLQELLTTTQVHSFFEDGPNLYQERLAVTRREILNKVEGILNQLIVDNESKLVEE